MKRRLLLMLIILSLLLTGCLVKKSPWAVTIHHAQYRTQLQGSFGTYSPDPGYVWLVINVSMTNLSKSEQSLNPYLDSFSVVTANGNTYSWQMHYYSIGGELSDFYPPQETRRGDIYFHVPANFSLSNAKLIFAPWDNPQTSINLTNVGVLQ